ncbi:MAG: hypothetical protein ACLTKG_05065 [Collinsella intestinalis]
MAAMAFFGLFIWLTWRYVRDRRARVGLTAFLCVMIAAVGFPCVPGCSLRLGRARRFCASLSGWRSTPRWPGRRRRGETRG